MTWRVAHASVIGSSHLKNNVECQDSHAVAVRQKDDDSLLVCIVSDGAGSAPRSAEGSTRACESILGSVVSWWESGAEPLTDREITDWLFAASASITEIAEKEGMHPRQFACTAVGGVVWNKGAVYFQLGDGGVVVHDESGYRLVFWPSDSEALNLTYFLTDEAWWTNLQIARSDSPPAELAVFTDGIQLLVLDYVNRKAHSPFFSTLFSQLRSYGDDQLALVNEALRGYLASNTFDSRTDDDKTLVLAASDFAAQARDV